MISAIVMFLNENGVGGGFYRKAASLGLIASERMSADAKFDFWVRQMTAVVAWAQDHLTGVTWPRRAIRSCREDGVRMGC